VNVEALKIDRGNARPGSRRRRSPWLGRAVALAILIGLGFVFWTPIGRLVDRIRLPLVQVMRVVESHPAAAGAVRGAAASGHIVAARRAALSADTPGRIVELNVTEGSVVKAGAIVARLYSDEYAAALQQAEAELLAARARAQSAEVAIGTADAELEQLRKTEDAARENVAETEAARALAQAEHARVADLVARGVSSHADLDTAKMSLDTSAAQVRAAEARLRAATAMTVFGQKRIAAAQADRDAAHAEVQVRAAARDLAAATLDKTIVRAPFDGVVVLKDAEVGEVVSPNSQGGSNARGSVCTMVDLASLEVQAEVPETSLAAVAVGRPVAVYVDAFADHAYTARVDRIWPTANRQKATIEVRAKFDAPDGRLRPEMSVRVVFLADEATPAADTAAPAAILVPEGAVIELDGARGVFLLERDVVRFRSVELGDRRAGRVAVLAGLEPGQQIVVDPPLHLRPGDRVRIQQS
jgi:RND family efflux transporter MFP subunit